MFSRICPCCGKTVDDFIEFGCAWPKAWIDVPAVERKARCRANSSYNADYCSVDLARFFVRGVLALPLTDSADPSRMGWGLWAELTARDVDAYSVALRKSEPFECDGTLSVEPLGNYDALDGARVHIADSGAASRPLFTLLDCDNPSRARLHCQQTNGITLAQAHAIAREIFPSQFGDA